MLRWRGVFDFRDFCALAFFLFSGGIRYLAITQYNATAGNTAQAQK